jgi:hypothetical protein
VLNRDTADAVANDIQEELVELCTFEGDLIFQGCAVFIHKLFSEFKYVGQVRTLIYISLKLGLY